MSSPSPTTFMPLSSHWKLQGSLIPTDEKSSLEKEIRDLKRKVDLKEDVVRELNKTLFHQRFQQNPESYVRSLTKDSLASSMDLIGQRVRRFFQKNSSITNDPSLIENAIKNRFKKIRSLHQIILQLKEIELDPQFQKAPRPYLENWQKTQPESTKVKEIITTILNETTEDD